MRPSIQTEIPPDILPGGKRLSWFLTTENSERCDAQASETAVAGPAVDCQAAGRSVTQTRPDYLDRTPEQMPAGREHRSHYFGVYTATHARAADGSNWIVEATHGENKNVVRGGRFYQNSVYKATEALIPTLGGSCFSGPDPVTWIYEDCYAAYTGWVGTARVPENSSNNWGLQEPEDLGPAVWPIGGYVSADRLTLFDHGVRHPSIVEGGDGYLYMFYYDDGLWPGNTRSGFRVARALESDLGRGWKTWVESRQQWVTSLPSGHIGADSSTAALAQPSPAADSTALFPSTASTFAVARVRGRKGFVGIDQGRDWTRPCTTPDGRSSYRSFTRLRVSPDGTHWSSPVELTGRHFDDCDFFVYSYITYPRFMDAAGTSTKDVSLEDFNIIGTRYGGQIWRIPVSAPELASQLPVDNWASDDPDRSAVPDASAPPSTPVPSSPPSSTPDAGRDTATATPRATVTVKPAAVGRTKGSAKVSVIVRKCTATTSAVRVKVANRWHVVQCGKTRTISRLRAGRTYTVVVQAIRMNARKQVTATGTRARKTVKIPTYQAFARR
jgi:hypothetical protein